MARYCVLVTDYAWPNLYLEQEILHSAEAELLAAPSAVTEVLVKLAPQADAIMTCWASVKEPVLRAASKCRMVARLGIGLDNIDVKLATELGMLVTNVPDYCQTEVAEHTLALLLSLARKTAYFHHDTMQGRYDLQAGPALRRITGQTLGIVGLGSIGQAVASRAQAFGLQVLAAASRTGASSTGPIPRLPLAELLPQCDYLSLHLPLTPETRHLISAAQFAAMKPSAYLINTSRGGLVDHAALAVALELGQLAGAALDVQDPEPPELTQAPWNHPCVLVTPHAAFYSLESVLDLRRRTASQVAAFLMGKDVPHVVNRN